MFAKRLCLSYIFSYCSDSQLARNRTWIALICGGFAQYQATCLITSVKRLRIYLWKSCKRHLAFFKRHVFTYICTIRTHEIVLQAYQRFSVPVPTKNTIVLLFYATILFVFFMFLQLLWFKRCGFGPHNEIFSKYVIMTMLLTVNMFRMFFLLLFRFLATFSPFLATLSENIVYL